ncbi:hypothetical protein [Thauera sp. SDU_THAU2]|uniref:hypothetical protein n=1 Tax=Thauera sp. SDU_THAU2 TaxID=3136633 RepID=UPI00311F441B
MGDAPRFAGIAQPWSARYAVASGYPSFYLQTSQTNEINASMYDPAGNRTRTTWPETAFYVTTTYDALNRPTAVKETGTVNLAIYAHDDLSRRTTVTLGNGTTSTYGYGAQGTLSSLAHNLAGTAQDVTYSSTTRHGSTRWRLAASCRPIRSARRTI